MIPPKAVFKLFDSLIVPVVAYASEVWLPSTNILGLLTSWRQSKLDGVTNPSITKDPLESLHVTVLKWIIGVPKRTSVMAVLGDCGRVPLAITLSKQLIDYHNHIVSLSLKDDDSLVVNAFVEQRTMKLSWYSSVTKLVSLDEKPANVDSKSIKPYYPNSKLCRNKLHEIFLDLWDSSRHNNRKLGFFNSVKDSFGEEEYLSLCNYKERSCLAKFRMSSHVLAIETGRHISSRKNKFPSIVDRCCRLCCDIDNLTLLCELPTITAPIIEDENHLLLDCPAYDTIRGGHDLRTLRATPNKVLGRICLRLFALRKSLLV